MDANENDVLIGPLEKSSDRKMGDRKMNRNVWRGLWPARITGHDETANQHGTSVNHRREGKIDHGTHGKWSHRLIISGISAIRGSSFLPK